MAEACWRCGTTEADTYRFCSARKRFVCLQCEKVCDNYSRKLLPNGTNCRLTCTFPQREFFGYLANQEEVKAAKEKYKQQDIMKLRLRLEELHRTHNRSSNTEIRVSLRVELAAINEVLKERGA